MFTTKDSATLHTWEDKSASRFPVFSTIDPREVEDVGDGFVFVALGDQMRKIRAQVEMLAQGNIPVLIVGERGTDKEVVARLIHKLYFGRTEGFRKINCSSPHALDDGLSLRRGSGKSGPETEEDGAGTLFLDDLAALPESSQARLLHEIQHLQPRMQSDQIRRQIRVVAASEPSVREAVEARKLRWDLYERMSTLIIQVPPLRQRQNEIDTLLQFTMNRLAQRCGVAPRTLSPAVFGACRSYSWPGNSRELEDYVRQYLLFGDSAAGPGPEHGMSGAGGVAVKTLVGPDGGGQVAEQGSERNSFLRGIRGETERKAIAVALEKTGWNRKAAAQLLKVSYRTLLYKISHYKMSPPEELAAPKAR